MNRVLNGELDHSLERMAHELQAEGLRYVEACILPVVFRAISLWPANCHAVSGAFV
jgi:hypothetical protein